MTAQISDASHLRYVTAAALFDGHDASINIIRRLLVQAGAEVIHLGHNRSVPEIVSAVLQEDADGVAISSYQGGHVEFFKFLHDELAARDLGHVAIFGGGGGVIIPTEIQELHGYGISRIYSPDDGRELGLLGIVADMNRRTAEARARRRPPPGGRAGQAAAAEDTAFAYALSCLERHVPLPEALRPAGRADRVPVVGITGTGGAGKSSLADELLRRHLAAHPRHRVAILAVDPSKRKTGGALLGDRIRMNAIGDPRCFLHSFATRGAPGELSAAVGDAVQLARAWGFDLIFVETSGIGQGDSGISEISDLAIYVMTSEFGSPIQLEKIDMIDFADLIVVNKFDRPGSEDALRDVRKQYRRSRGDFGSDDEALPVFGTIASRFNDSGVSLLAAELDRRLAGLQEGDPPAAAGVQGRVTRDISSIIPPERVLYLGEIARSVRAYRQRAAADADRLRRWDVLRRATEELAAGEGDPGLLADLQARLQQARSEVGEEALAEVESWDQLTERYAADEVVVRIRDRELRFAAQSETLAGTRIPKIALPRLSDPGDRLLWLRRENVPGIFPFTAGVFPFKRTDEEPKRQFAGEGSPQRTNRRFHYLCRDDDAKRLSTAFDSLTLYGEDPAERPDIYGKIGEGGVSICTLEDMKALYDGFDLCHPNTSVSMTINGPAAIILAMFFNSAIDQQLEQREREQGRPLTAAEREEIVACTLATVRGTVQADILKEDQAQNTCIFSTEFALRLMGDVQEYFVQHDVRNYYSVSISGYHIAEAGANPISQLAFTLANGFTYVEYYRARGMDIDAFAPNLSFFFSNGLDAEYTVIGRVARRIWSIAMRDLYGANERSQKLKYHIQTSGRSLHAQEIAFNDIRTTLQALMAIYDNCNSLHTNSYDEAITTPSEESVRRAMAIQMIINRELGWTRCENPLQGAAIIDQLTELVEEAVLCEFENLSRRGGVLGAMETQYQRGKIQEESLLYEQRKHSGELPIIGVNTYVKESDAAETVAQLTLARCDKQEKDQRLAALRDFQARHAAAAPEALARLQQVAVAGGNLFAELMSTVRTCSLGQITRALYEVGGQYRRAM